MFGGGKAVADAVDANTGDVLKMLNSSVVIFLSGRKERKVIYAD